MNKPIGITGMRDRIVKAVLDDYRRQDNPGFSDLDNEQPISIHIHVRLGDLRHLSLMDRLR
jgi:hypothetical protein